MTARIKTLCDEATQALRTAKRETAGTYAEELLDGANVVRVTLNKSPAQSVTAVFKDVTASGERKLLELILTRYSTTTSIEAVYKIAD